MENLYKNSYASNLLPRGRKRFKFEDRNDVVDWDGDYIRAKKRMEKDAD